MIVAQSTLRQREPTFGMYLSVSRLPVHMKTYQRDAFRGHNAVLLQVNGPVNEMMAQLPCCSCEHHHCVNGSDLSGLVELPLADKIQTPNSVLPRRFSFQISNSQVATWLRVKTDPHENPCAHAPSYLPSAE